MRRWKHRLPAYGWHTFTGDLMGGLIAALIALPYGLAMAHLMGLPPAMGIYTSVLTAPVTALLGRNPLLIGGASSVTVPFLASAVERYGAGGAAKVTILAAVFMMALSVLRVGRHFNKVPSVVVSGFSCGIGAMMVISQLKAILGLQPPPGGWSNVMLVQLAQALAGIGGMHWRPLLLATIVVAAASLAAHRSRRAPAPLAGVAGASVLAFVLGWTETTVGTVSFDMPALATFSWTPGDVFTVLPSACALALVASANLLVTSRIVYHFSAERRAMRRADADAEVGAYGIANLLAGLFGAPMSVGIPARSLANLRCGGTTRIANLFHASVLGLILWLGSEWVSHVPLAALAGVTVWTGWQLLDWSTWRRLFRIRRVESAVFLVTAAAILATNAVIALVLGCFIYSLPWLRGLISPQQSHSGVEARSQGALG
jgi:SulP family sulfate permease